MYDCLADRVDWRGIAICVLSTGVYILSALSIINGCHIDVPTPEPVIVYQDQWEPDWEGISIKADQEAESYLYSQRI